MEKADAVLSSTGLGMQSDQPIVLDELAQAALRSIAVGVYTARLLGGRFCGLHDGVRRCGSSGFQPFQEGNGAVQHGGYPPNAHKAAVDQESSGKTSTFEAIERNFSTILTGAPELSEAAIKPQMTTYNYESSFGQSLALRGVRGSRPANLIPNDRFCTHSILVVVMQAAGNRKSLVQQSSL
ncbi:hypothetical protein J2X72_002324 [Phyllobacterium sp. 1468]|uniref:hypothetical protein n=1 Tax=Phyllobacterium sp. 1468 TaxID=2817759 RepID=UPI002855F647|nr:hypothetical protein [Phyllobacterium sp. 1468]MDR6633531.1 hypothetical protein [Phyllobacterium sp. 1468]